MEFQCNFNDREKVNSPSNFYYVHAGTKKENGNCQNVTSPIFEKKISSQKCWKCARMTSFLATSRDLIIIFIIFFTKKSFCLFVCLLVRLFVHSLVCLFIYLFFHSLVIGSFLHSEMRHFCVEKSKRRCISSESQMEMALNRCLQCNGFILKKRHDSASSIKKESLCSWKLMRKQTKLRNFKTQVKTFLTSTS